METPVKPAPINGYRSRAINAAVDFADALRPVAGNGVRIADGPAGKVISIDGGMAVAARPCAWTVRAVPVPSASNAIEWGIRVYAGLVTIGGEELASSLTPDGTDEATGLNYYALTKDAGADWLCVGNDDHGGGWGLEWHTSPFSPLPSPTRWRAIAYVTDDSPPKITQYEAGVIDLDQLPIMPFDIVLLANGHYAVYVGSSGALTLDNDYAPTLDSTIDAAGYIDLGTTPSGAWLYVRVEISSGAAPVWHWGVLNTAPQSSAQYRYVANWQIGEISAGTITQYWHGRIRIADMEMDGNSVERDSSGGGDGAIQLRDFSGTSTLALNDIADVDWLVRDDGYQDGPHLAYVAGSTLANLITNIVDQIITELTNRNTTRGGEFLGAMDLIYQQTVRTDTTTDGTASGTYHGIPPTANGEEWQPA